MWGHNTEFEEGREHSCFSCLIRSAPGAGFTKVQPRQWPRTPLSGRPTLSLMLCCCCLDILHTLWARAAHSHCVWRPTNPVACLAATPHLMVTFSSLDYWGGERQFQNQRSGRYFRNHLVHQTRQWFNFTARATKVQKARIDFLKVMHKSWKRSQIGRLKWWVCKAVNTKAVVSLCIWRISAYQWENSRLSLSSVNCGWSDWSRGMWIQWKEEGGNLWTGQDNCMKGPV